jgi:AcrR family transcriptional regulator
MLEAATEIFLERGFEATTVGEIVARSGGSLATLYAWFGSKESLFEAIVEELSSQIVAPLDAPEFESRPLDEALRLFGERFVALLLSPRVLRWRRMCVSEGPRSPALRAALLRTGPGRVRERLAAYLTTQAETGGLHLDVDVFLHGYARRAGARRR